jgi:membrane carboxypeptidase/penicillin-binding protein PbpC
VVGVWVGNADGEPMRDVSGISGAGPVWHAVMEAAHRGLPAREFPRPAGIVELSVCAEGGMLPGPACPATRPERFVAGSEPRKADTSHVAVQVDRLLGCRAPAGYPAARTTTQIFRLLPPEAQAWASQSGIAAPPRQLCAAPPGGPAQAAAGAAANGQAPERWGGPVLTAPADGATFRISAGVPRERQLIAVQAHSGGTNTRLTIVIDEETIATCASSPCRAFWRLAPGEHVALVESDGVRSAEVRFAVIE